MLQSSYEQRIKKYVDKEATKEKCELILENKYLRSRNSALLTKNICLRGYVATMYKLLRSNKIKVAKPPKLTDTCNKLSKVIP